MKTTIFFVCLLFLSLLTACDQLGIDLAGNANSGDATAILITDPPDGTHASVGPDRRYYFRSHHAHQALSPFTCLWIGTTYYVDQMYQQTANFQIFQPWTPKEPGVFTYLERSLRIWAVVR